VRKGLIVENSDVLVRSDNTNAVYNLNRKRSGWRMRRAVKSFLVWLKQRQIRIECSHIRGEENQTADSLSRLSKSGDYSLKEGVLERAETMLGEPAEVDLFARRTNRQKERYCTVEVDNDRHVIARDAMSIRWTGWTALIHPPIPMIVRTLTKIQREGTRAIVIVPAWKGALRMERLRVMTIKGPVILGKCEELLDMGPGMRTKSAALPPGLLQAVLVQGAGSEN
jgi:hypothetical protein